MRKFLLIQTLKSTSKTLFKIFVLGVFCGIFGDGSFGTFADAVRADEPRSAAELAELLSSKLEKPFEIPTTFSCDVLAAEQRDNAVLILKSGADWNDSSSVIWKWNADDSPEIAPEDRQFFANVSECKAVRGGTCVLVAASSGGVALVRIADKKTLFYGTPGGNPHSAALLPDGNIVSASSTGAVLTLYYVPNIKSNAKAPNDDQTESNLGRAPAAETVPFFDAHGVVWDAKRQTLWALGGREIAGFQYVGTKEKPELKEIFRQPLNHLALGGHDLTPAPGFDALTTTGRGISVFDPEKREFYPVAKLNGVKSFSVSPEGVPLMLRVVREEDLWWRDSATFGNQDDSPLGTLDGAKFYKTRWFQPDEFGENGTTDANETVGSPENAASDAIKSFP